MPESEFDVLPEITDPADRQRLANAARIGRKLEQTDWDGTMNYAALAGALGLSGTASGQPSTTDQDPEVGLPNDRVDVWSDSTDASDVYARQLGQATHSDSISGSYTVNSDDGNVHDYTLTGDATVSFSHPTSYPNGFSLSMRFDVGDYEPSWSGVTWEGGDSPTQLPSETELFVDLRTYNGGSDWYGGYAEQLDGSNLYNYGEGESDWTGVSGTTSKDSNHLNLLDNSTFDYNDPVDISNYSTLILEWDCALNADVLGEAEITANGTTIASKGSLGWSFSHDEYDISSYTMTADPLSITCIDGDPLEVYEFTLIE